MISIPPPFED